MRHLGSVILALVVAPLVLVLVGRGLVAFDDAAAAASVDHLATAWSLAALVLGGMLFAWLSLTRFSPLGPGLAGLGYLALGLVLLLDREDLLAQVRTDLVGLDDQQLAAAASVAPLLAIPLVLTLFSARRWRGHDLPGGPVPVYAPGTATLRDTAELPTVPVSYLESHPHSAHP